MPRHDRNTNRRAERRLLVLKARTAERNERLGIVRKTKPKPADTDEEADLT
jgi:hypothetical protein